MVGTIAIATAKAQLFENRTIWNLTFKVYILNGRISNPQFMFFLAQILLPYTKYAPSPFLMLNTH